MSSIDSGFSVIPDLNQAPPASPTGEGTAEPPVEDAPPQLPPHLQVIHDQIVDKLERRVSLQAPKYGVIVDDPSIIKQCARYVIRGLEMDNDLADNDLEGLQNLLKKNPRSVNLIIKQFFEERARNG